MIGVRSSFELTFIFVFWLSHSQKDADARDQHHKTNDRDNNDNYSSCSVTFSCKNTLLGGELARIIIILSHKLIQSSLFIS